MGKLIKLLITLALFGFIGLVGYAYIGPFLGVDFAVPSTEVRQPVQLLEQ